MKDNSKQLKKAEDHFMTTFALSSINDENDEKPCPSAELLTAYFEGHLKGQEYENIKAHIDHCTKCFNISLAVYSCVQSSLLWKISHFFRIHKWKGMFKNTIQNWLQTIVNLYEDLKQCLSNPVSIKLFQVSLLNRKRMYLVPVLMTLMIGLFFLWPDSHTLEDRIQKSYDMIKQKRLITDIFFLPWEEPMKTYGIVDSSRYIEKFAFGAGLWEGVQELPRQISPHMDIFLENFTSSPGINSATKEWYSKNWKGKRWSESQLKDYFLLGKWCYIQRYICLARSDVNQNFWDNQKIILNQLIENIQHHAKNDINITIIRSLKLVQHELNLIHKDKLLIIDKKKIESELFHLIRYLCPV